MKYPPTISTLLCIAALLVFAPFARADVIVLANRTLDPIETRVTLPGDKPQLIKLGKGDVVPVPVISEATVAFNSGKAQKLYRIKANSIAYLFSKPETPDLVELVERHFGKKDAVDKLPAQPEAATAEQLARLRKVGTIPIKLLVDDDEPAVAQVWEKRLKDRIAQASEIFEKHCLVRLKVAETDTWDSQDDIVDFYFTIREFEKEVVPGKKAALAIGFSSQYKKPRGRVHMGGTRGPLHPYILIREWSQHVAYSERLEIVVHEIGHVLGAPHSPDKHSVMRPLVSDGKARDRDYRIAFDPMNTLVIFLFCEELRLRGARSLRHFRPERRKLLQSIYREMQKEMPKENSAQRYIAFFERASKPLASRQLPTGAVSLGNCSKSPKKRIAITRKMAEAIAPASTGDPSKAKTLISATRFVVAAIQHAAEENQRPAMAAATGSRKSGPHNGDQLTALYVQRAAQTAVRLPPEMSSKAFLLGLAIGFDTSDQLRNHPVIGLMVKLIESDTQHRRRLKALGKPTMNGRQDLLQHFAVSAVITALAGEQSAHSIGIEKEMADSRGGSGFSFRDLAADLAGVSFAKHLLDSKIRLSNIVTTFFVDSYMPAVEDLPEGLSQEEFSRQFGSTADRRFLEKKAAIQRRVLAMPGYLLINN
ncbi:MAG: matrixin family metalloprotease [Planctomycetota bacterium]|nr:matrixin family metalloprotease [Planctomycetota bacterium]